MCSSTFWPVQPDSTVYSKWIINFLNISGRMALTKESINCLDSNKYMWQAIVLRNTLLSLYCSLVVQLVRVRIRYRPSGMPKYVKGCQIYNLARRREYMLGFSILLFHLVVVDCQVRINLCAGTSNFYRNHCCTKSWRSGEDLCFERVFI